MTPGFFLEKDVFAEQVEPIGRLQISLVIPTRASSQFLDRTIESIVFQKYPFWEALFIDADSKDRTAEIIRSYKDPRIRLQTMPKTRVFEMINRGLSMAQGEYILILNPGDELMHPRVLSMLSYNVQREGLVDLYITASEVRDEELIPHLIFRPLTIENTKKGIQPSSLQSVLFKRDVFKKIGLFNGKLRNRGAFDFFCRCAKHPNLTSVMLERVFVTQNQMQQNAKFYLLNFIETFRILFSQYGFLFAFRWIFLQKDLLRFLQKLKVKVKRAFQKGYS